MLLLVLVDPLGDLSDLLVLHLARVQYLLVEVLLEVLQRERVVDDLDVGLRAVAVGELLLVEVLPLLDESLLVVVATRSNKDRQGAGCAGTTNHLQELGA